MSLMAAQPDLFGDSGLPRLSQADEIVTQGAECKLITSIDAGELSPFGSTDG